MFYAERSKTNLMSQKDDDFILQQRERQKKEKHKHKSWRASPLLPLISKQRKACDKQQFQARRILQEIWLELIWPSCHRDKKTNRMEGKMKRTTRVPNFTIWQQTQAF